MSDDWRVRLFIKLGRMALNDWERRLKLFFGGLFLLQFVYWFGQEDMGFLPSIIKVMEYTVLIVFLLQLPVRMQLWLRLILQFIALLGMNALAVGYHYIPYYKVTINTVAVKFHFFSAVSQVFENNASQLIPASFFIAGAWLIYLLAIWWIKAKWRISFMVVFGVVAVAVRDSFSTNQLWSESAMMIFCGLCLLVVHHFAALKRKNPTSWAYIAEYPGALALPVVLILGLAMLLGSLAPDVSNLLTDPYTLYQNWKGETVTKIIKPGSSSSASSSKGNNASGYSRNDEKLGGGFDFDYSPVMNINASQRSYWRGETRSLYTGAGWDISDADKLEKVSSVIDASPFPDDPKVDTSKLKTVDVTQTVTFERDTLYPVLFGALNITKINAIDEANSGYENYGLQWSSSHAELRTNLTKSSGKPFPKTYTIISKVPIIDPVGLRTSTLDPTKTAALQEYLNLPKELPARVKALTESLTVNQTNQYDKVKAIEAYLQKLPYTNRPDLKSTTSKDFVDKFLFELKTGYCDYFSTAMAVMARTIDIPTRWVKGYTSGTSSQEQARERGSVPDGVITNIDGPDLYSVRNSNAHSWVEVYFEGWGWIPFEPTSGFILPKAIVNDGTTPLVDDHTVATNTNAGNNKSNPMLLITALIGAVIVIAGTLWLLRAKLQKLRQRIRIVRRLQRRKAENLNDQVVNEYSRLLRYLKRKGFSSDDYETAREMFQRWSEKKKWLIKEFDALLALFEKAKYSGKAVTTDELKQAHVIFKRLRQEM
ncbi:MAG: transglutaminase protein [Bacilli bacterium]|nr:transglutaminase protein [Bacilli bacterium]